MEQTTSDKTSPSNKHEGRRQNTGLLRNRKHVEEGSNNTNVYFSGPNVEQHIPQGEEKWEVSTHNKFEKSEFLHSLSTLQDGRVEQCKGFTSEGRLHGENRPNRCLFFTPTPQELQKIPEISMGGENIRISLPLFRAGPSPKNFYEINESTYQCLEENNDQISNLPRRHTNKGEDHGRDNYPQRLCNLPPGKFGFCHKLGEIHLDPSKGNRFSRNHNKQSIHDNDSTSGESGQTDFFVLESTELKRGLSSGPFKPHCQTNSYIPSSNSSLFTDKIPDDVADTGTKIQFFVHQQNSIGQSEQERTGVVDRESENKQREIHSNQTPRHDNTNRCLFSRMGAHCQGMTTGGAWTQEETSFHINVLELKAVYLGLLTFTTNRKPSHIHFQIDNTCAIAYLLKMGGGGGVHETDA